MKRKRYRQVCPGEVIKIKDMEMVILDSFDPACLVTADDTTENREG